MSIVSLGDGELRDKCAWHLEFRYENGKFMPLEASQVVQGYKSNEKFRLMGLFEDITGQRPNDQRGDWLSLDNFISFELRGLYMKTVDQKPRQVLMIVGTKYEAKIFVPNHYMVSVIGNINPMQAFRFVCEGVQEGDILGIQGMLLKPI